jgi:hypothetical protein
MTPKTTTATTSVRPTPEVIEVLSPFFCYSGGLSPVGAVQISVGCVLGGQLCGALPESAWVGLMEFMRVALLGGDVDVCKVGF